MALLGNSGSGSAPVAPPPPPITPVSASVAAASQNTQAATPVAQGAPQSSSPLAGAYSADSTGAPVPWKASTWQPGQPVTSDQQDLSHIPTPTAADISAQRDLINQRLSKYGYKNKPNLTDQQVLQTMAPLPQGPQKWEPWVEDYFKRNPSQRNVGARPGVDVPYDQTYTEASLKSKGLSGTPVQQGYQYAIPRAAMIEHYGKDAVQNADDDWIREHSTPGANLDIVHE